MDSEWKPDDDLKSLSSASEKDSSSQDSINSDDFANRGPGANISSDEEDEKMITVHLNTNLPPISGTRITNIDTVTPMTKEEDDEDDEDALPAYKPPAPIVLHRLEELIGEGDVTFAFTDWKKPFGEAVLSTPDVVIGGIPWRIRLFPSGNKTMGFVSAFLEYNKEALDPAPSFQWECFILYQIAILHPDGRLFHVQQSNHRFTSAEVNWGYSKMADHKTILREGLIVDNSLTVTLHVKVVRGYSPEWGFYSHYDSKRATGMVGINNQGATCYMNSLLQTLFHTNLLRIAVFNMPTENDDPIKGVALALQRVFYRLQTSGRAIETGELTRSFGWDSSESFMQHDVQEFNRVLCDNLEEKMKKTRSEGLISKLFQGKTKSYIRCTQIDFKSEREETFLDIQLNVKGMKDVLASFDNYVAVEDLDGDNKYMAEGHGLQPAKKGVTFLSLPDVLNLQLKRFEYDPYRDENYKINDRYEFPLEVDLSRFVEEAAPGSYTYILHSILVHSGTIHGGHYIVYIRPDPHGGFYKFDDESVTEVPQKEAVDGSFGGEFNDGFLVRKNTRNAYMLVYIRSQSIPEVLRPVTLEDVPKHLIKRFTEEEAELIRVKEEERNALKYLTVLFLTDTVLHAHINHDLYSSASKLEEFKALKTLTVAEFKAEVAAKYQTRSELLRFWVLRARESRTVRPFHCLLDGNDSELAISVFGRARDVYGRVIISKYFLEILPQPAPYPAPEDSLVFFKYFDAENNDKACVHYVGHRVVNRSHSGADLIEMGREMLDFSSDIPLLAFEEFVPKEMSFPAIQPEESLASARITTGSIIILQKQPSQDCNWLYPFVENYFNELLNRVTVEFRNLSPATTTTTTSTSTTTSTTPATTTTTTATTPPTTTTTPVVEDSFKLSLLKSSTYAQVAAAVAEKIGLDDPTKLQFSVASSTYYSDEKVPSTSANLGEMLTTARNTDLLLQFAKIPVPITEFENGIQHDSLFWFDQENFSLVKVDTVFPKFSTVADIVNIVSKEMKPLQNGSNTFRAVETKYRFDVARPTDTLSFLRYTPLRVEEIPRDQLPENLSANQAVVKIEHFHKDVFDNHGIPFYFVVSEGELVSDLSKRLQTFMKVSDTEFAKWKLHLVYLNRAILLNPEDTITLRDLKVYGYLAFQHQNKSPKKYRSAWAEKAVKIHN